MRRLKIFVTGGEGFIGKNVVDGLSDKYKIFAPSHRELDILDEPSVSKYLKKHGPFDVVVHCANVGGTRTDKETPLSTATNIQMFLNIISNKDKYKKLINLGSGAEYNKKYDIKKIKENQVGISVPYDSYGLSKYICSQTINFLGNSVHLRLFAVYGKYENYKLRFISSAICKSILDLPITINQNVYFDYLYVNDFLKILDYFIQNDASHKIYNVGSGFKIDLKEIGNIVSKVSGKKSKIVIKSNGFGNEYTCNNNLLKKEIGKIQFTNFEDSISELYRWYEANQNLWDKKYFID